jgi:predicted O-methyltransferase YrrM
MNWQPSDREHALKYVAALQALTAEPLDEQAFEREAEGLRLQVDLGPVAGELAGFLVGLIRPRHILEIGTAAGITACRLGREAARFGGRVLTLEIDPEMAAAAKANLRRVGLDEVVEVRCTDARVWLEQAVREAKRAGEARPEHEWGFGLIVQDGGKDDYLAMLDGLVSLLRPEGLLITDDILFPVMNLPPHRQSWREVMDVHNRALAVRPDLRTIWLPVGDGVAISTKKERDPASSSSPC